MKQRNKTGKQKGSALFIMIMILVALSILTFMATNAGKTDARIGNAYTQQTKAFIQAEEMLGRLRYAIEQMPLPEGIKNTGNADVGANPERPIWLAENLSTAAAKNAGYINKNGVPDFTDPRFAQDAANKEGWSDNKTLTCGQLVAWMKTYPRIAPMDCNAVDPNNQTRTLIELVSRRQSKGDISDISDTFYYRITIRARSGDASGAGEVLAQGLTGIQYN